MTFEISFARGDINPDLLDEELRAVVGAPYVGLSVTGDRVRVHASADVSALQTAIEQAIQAHDPQALTAAQTAQATRVAAAQRLRSTSWDQWTAADKDFLLQWVAVQLGALPEIEGV